MSPAMMNIMTDNTLEITGVSDNTPETTEVDMNVTETETATETEMCNNEHNIAPDTDNEPNVTGDSQDKNYEQYNDDISIKGETPEDIHKTINYMNTVHKMNAGQLYVNPDTGEAMEEEIDTPTHGYNLRPRPTKKSKIQHGEHWTTINYCQAASTHNAKPSRR